MTLPVRRLVGLLLLALPGVARAQSGYLKLTAPVDTMLVVVDDDLAHFRRLISGDSLELSAGTHRIAVASKRSYDFLFRPTSPAGRTLTQPIPLTMRKPGSNPDVSYVFQSSYPRLVWGGNLLVVTDYDSDIYIDGRFAGRGQVKLDTTAGTYRVRTENAIAGSSEQRVVVRRDRLWVTEMFNKPDKGRVRRWSWLPGGGQWVKSQPLKATAMVGLTTVGIGGIVAGAGSLHSKSEVLSDDELNRLLQQYRESRNTTLTTQIGVTLARQADLAREDARSRKLLYGGIGLAGAAYLWSVADAWLVAPRGGYRDRRIDPKVILAPFLAENRTGLRLQIAFR